MKEEIHTWLDKVEREAIVPAEVIALNFGLYETEKGTSLRDSLFFCYASMMDYLLGALGLPGPPKPGKPCG